ncbi:MAG: hypothetical protein WA210_07770 [Burkholderiaceae bacterium]
MSEQPPPTPAAAAIDATQLRYARLLDWGTRIGLALLVLSFLAYVSGALPPQVPVEQLPELWNQPVQRYLELSGAPTGWQWVASLQHGDMLALTGIALLAACSGVCVASLVPLYRARGDRAYLYLCLAQVAVLLLAASGLIVVG